MSFRNFLNLLIGIGVICGLVVFLAVINYLSAEQKTLKTLQNFCQSYWNYHAQNGRMYQESGFLQSDGIYDYFALDYSRHSNISMLYARPKNIEKKSYQALIFAPWNNKQKSYACRICISKKNNYPWMYPNVTKNGVGCPKSYRYVFYGDKENR